MSSTAVAGLFSIDMAGTGFSQPQSHSSSSRRDVLGRDTRGPALFEGLTRGIRRWPGEDLSHHRLRHQKYPAGLPQDFQPPTLAKAITGEALAIQRSLTAGLFQDIACRRLEGRDAKPSSALTNSAREIPATLAPPAPARAPPQLVPLYGRRQPQLVHEVFGGPLKTQPAPLQACRLSCEPYSVSPSSIEMAIRGLTRAARRGHVPLARPVRR